MRGAPITARVGWPPHVAHIAPEPRPPTWPQTLAHLCQPYTLWRHSCIALRCGSGSAAKVLPHWPCDAAEARRACSPTRGLRCVD